MRNARYIKRKINSAMADRVNRAAAQHVDAHGAGYRRPPDRIFNKGPESIEPLKMQQIADKVGVHVTTVSRAVDDKWIQLAQESLPLKRFFCGGTVSAMARKLPGTRCG